MVHLFKQPAVEVLREEELEENRRALYLEEKRRDYHQSMVEYYARRIDYLAPKGAATQEGDHAA